MGFDIPMRTRGALDRNSLIQNYGVQGDTASAPQNSASLNNSALNSGAQQQNANSNNRQNTPPQNNNYNQNQGGYSNQPNNYNQSPQNNYNNQNQGGYNNQPNNYNQPPQNNYNNQNQGGYNNQPNNYNQPPQNNYNNQNQGGYNNQPNNYNQPPQNNYNNQNQGYVNQPVNNGYNNYAPVNSGYNQNQGYVNQPVNNGYNNYAPVNSQFNDPLGGIGNTINGFVGGLDNSFNDVFTQNPTPNYGRPQNVDQTADTLGQTTSSGGVYSSRGQGMPNQPMNNPPVNRAQPNNSPNNRGGMTSAQNVVSGGVYQSNSMNNGSAQMQPAAPVKPRIQRQRLSRTGTLLAKGQKVQIKNKKGVSLSRIKICFGWEPMRDNVELDASAFMLGANGKVISDDWFIFYGQPESPDNSVKYEVYSEDPRSPDDASIEINLPKVSADVQKIVLAVTLYEASERRQNFSMVKDMYARITDCSDASETMRFEMKEGYATVTAMVLGELYRHNGEWKFNSVGSGVNKDLADFCGMYGVALE